MCGEIIWQFRQAWHIKSCFAPGIFVTINFYNPFPFTGRNIMNITAENIRTGNYIECGIKTIK